MYQLYIFFQIQFRTSFSFKEKLPNYIKTNYYKLLQIINITLLFNLL